MQVGPLLALDRDATRARKVVGQPGQNSQQGCFPRAVGAEDSQSLAGSDRELLDFTNTFAVAMDL